jgi:multifunctional 2-oxoglutarate metabolism enzyme
LRGAAGRIAENMAASVAVPLATSQRTIAVKVMDENRRIINQHRTLLGREQSLLHAPDRMGHRQGARGDPRPQPRLRRKATASRFRVVHPQINLGIAVDVAGKDGARNLLVPNIKNAGALNFQEYLNAFDDLVAAPAKASWPADFQGTTISLTNPGTVGTMSSNPRLMPGPGRHHRRRRHRLSRPNTTARPPKPAPSSASAR